MILHVDHRHGARTGMLIEKQLRVLRRRVRRMHRNLHPLPLRKPFLLPINLRAQPRAGNRKKLALGFFRRGKNFFAILKISWLELGCVERRGEVVVWLFLRDVRGEINDFLLVCRFDFKVKSSLFRTECSAFVLLPMIVQMTLSCVAHTATFDIAMVRFFSGMNPNMCF